MCYLCEYKSLQLVMPSCLHQLWMQDLCFLAAICTNICLFFSCEHTLMEILQIWHKYSLGFKDKLMRLFMVKDKSL